MWPKLPTNLGVPQSAKSRNLASVSLSQAGRTATKRLGKSEEQMGRGREARGQMHTPTALSPYPLIQQVCSDNCPSLFLYLAWHTWILTQTLIHLSLRPEGLSVTFKSIVTKVFIHTDTQLKLLNLRYIAHRKETMYQSCMNETSLNLVTKAKHKLSLLRWQRIILLQKLPWWQSVTLLRFSLLELLLRVFYFIKEREKCVVYLVLAPRVNQPVSTTS